MLLRHSLPESRQQKIEAGTDPGAAVGPPIMNGRSYSHSARRKNSNNNPVVVRSAVELRQGIDARSDELWLDASARDALGFAVMARVRTERPAAVPAVGSSSS